MLELLDRRIILTFCVIFSTLVKCSSSDDIFSEEVQKQQNNNDKLDDFFDEVQKQQNNNDKLDDFVDDVAEEIFKGRVDDREILGRSKEEYDDEQNDSPFQGIVDDEDDGIDDGEDEDEDEDPRSQNDESPSPSCQESKMSDATVREMIQNIERVLNHFVYYTHQIIADGLFGLRLGETALREILSKANTETEFNTTPYEEDLKRVYILIKKLNTKIYDNIVKNGAKYDKKFDKILKPLSADFIKFSRRSIKSMQDLYVEGKPQQI